MRLFIKGAQEKAREKIKATGMPEEVLKEAAADLNLVDVGQLYSALGNGDISVSKVVHRLFPAARPVHRYEDGISVLDKDHVWGSARDVKDVPAVLVERLQHYFDSID